MRLHSTYIYGLFKRATDVDNFFGLEKYRHNEYISLQGLVRGCAMRFSHLSKLAGAVRPLLEAVITRWPRSELKKIDAEKSGALRGSFIVIKGAV